MATYQYTAKDKSGHTVIGILDGASDTEVANILHKKELVVISVKPIKEKSLKVKYGKVKLDDLIIFSRQLATMIEAGITLVQALGILSEQIENRNLKKVVIMLRQDIEGGASFHDALMKYPAVFSGLFIHMIKAGDASGMLDEILDRLATYLEKTAALNRKIRSSLVYPEVVVSTAVLITAVLLLKVVPTFKGIFEIMGGVLPLPTRILIGVSDLLRSYFWLFLGFVGILAFLFKRYINTEKGRFYFDAQKLRIPVLGKLFRKVAISKFTRTFSTLTKSGVSILNTLDIVSKTSGNKTIEKAVMNSRKAISDGESISVPLSKSGVFPPIVCHMIAIGERTGQLEKMLSKLADFYDEQIDAQVAALTSMIEPVVILFLGIFIGGIVISLFLPIFKITELIAG